MNTSKQVNVMIGLLLLLVITFGIYFLWDQNVRSSTAQDRQVEENAERGGKVFAANCRICHGPNGQGALENSNFPGIPLNLDSNRVTDAGKLTPLRQRLTDTIRCGRIGTLMPPWSQDQGGPLTATQIDQLVTLITGSGEGGVSYNPEAVSLLGWEEAHIIAEEQDTLPLQGDPLRLTAAIGPNDTLIAVNDPFIGLTAGQFLRIGDEIVEIVRLPANSILAESISASTTRLLLHTVADFTAGDVIVIEAERVHIVSIDSENRAITVERGVDNTAAVAHKNSSAVQDPSDKILVQRGAFSTDAAAHEAGTQIFNGPLPPPTEPLTGEAGTPPCGQLAPAPSADGGANVPAPSEGQPAKPAGAQAVQEEVTEPDASGIIATAARDNFFTLNNFLVSLGASFTIQLANEGSAPHNLRIAGADGTWESADDMAVPQDGSPLTGGGSAQATFTAGQAGTFVFRCDFHPTNMWGQITIQ